MLRKVCFLTIFLFLLPVGLQAQHSNLRSKKILSTGNTPLDSMVIWPGSLQLKCAESGDPISQSSFSLDPIDARITWNSEPPCDEIVATYRILPESALQRYSNKNYSDYINPEGGFVIDPFVYRPAERESVFELEGFSYAGNLERGISFGNSQNLSLSSSFNLQLQGEVAKGVNLKAALTDNNIPLQPQGNTQQLQEFDQVFIELSTASHRLVLGDYRVRTPAGYFLKYNRRLSGARYEGSVMVWDSTIKVSPQFSAAFSGGKFSRNEFRGEEGNQGPYRLRGAEGETFIIVLPGTERIYINGDLLERGADRDYIIDYNTGELTFTPNRIITQDLRIVAEFEYSVQSYAHNMFHVGTGVDIGNWGFDVHFFSEQDNKNRTLGADLTPEDQRFLSNLGDPAGQILAPGETEVPYVEDRVLYNYFDTTVGGVFYDSIFRVALTNTETVYAVSFSFVGLGEGDYIIASTGVNGRVYEWVAPVNGVSQGDYAPLKTIIAPNQNQMLTVGIRSNDLGGGKLKTEMAFSNEDLNTFSRLDSENNRGWSGRADYEKQWLQKDGLSVSTTKFYEYRQKNFARIERYREVEFERNFGIQGLADTASDHYAGLDLDLGLGKRGAISYSASAFNRKDLFTGVNQNLHGTIQDKGWRLRLRSSLLTGTNVLFARPFFDLSYAPKALNGWRIGFDMQNEWNAVRQGDSLQTGSFKYQQYTFYTNSPDTSKIRTGLSYMLRYEHYDAGLSFSTPLVRTHTAKWTGAFLQTTNHKLYWTLTYRNYQDDRAVPNTTLENFYLGRIRYDGFSKKPWIRWNTFYEIGAGQQQRTEFTFLKVQDGQGDYQWIDNGDGIPTQDEFFVSPYQDQNNYIRVLVPTGEFFPVTETRFNQVISLNPATVWNGKKGLKGVLARFSDQATIQLNKEVFAGEGISIFNSLNPVAIGVPDSLLAGLDVLARNTLFFNRNKPGFQMEYTVGLLRNKQLQTNGFDDRKNQNQRIGMRWNFWKNFSLNGQFEHSIISSYSDFFPERRYQIIRNAYEAGLSYLKDNRLKFDLRYAYSFQSNAFPVNGGQFAVSHRIDLEGKWKRVGKSTVSGRMSVHQIGYAAANTNAQVEFQMLQNLKPGTNLVWQAIFERQLTDFLQLSFIYDGRLPASGQTVHVGRAQVRAVF